MFPEQSQHFSSHPANMQSLSVLFFSTCSSFCHIQQFLWFSIRSHSCQVIELMPPQPNKQALPEDFTAVFRGRQSHLNDLELQGAGQVPFPLSHPLQNGTAQTTCPGALTAAGPPGWGAFHKEVIVLLHPTPVGLYSITQGT